MNAYEIIARSRKVDRIIDAMDATMRHRVTADEAAILTPAQMTAILARAGVNPPSAATMASVAARLVARDATMRGW
jgi:hypothetical protein